MVYVPISLLGLVVAICTSHSARLLAEPDTGHISAHQLALSMGQLDLFILLAPREGVISANKEGLISVTGEFGTKSWVYMADVSAPQGTLPSTC